MSTPSPIPTETKIDYLYPLTLVFKPVVFVVDSVDWVVQVVLGYLSRMGVFSFGEWNRSWMKKHIIDIWKRGCDNTADRQLYDENRHLQAYNALEKVGGVQKFIYSKDGTKIDMMRFSYQDMLKKIQAHGGQMVSTLPITVQEMTQMGKEVLTHATEVAETEATDFIDAIVFGNRLDQSALWNELSQEGFDQLGLERVQLNQNGAIVPGYIVKHWDSARPDRPKEGQCIVRCCSPTESYPMAKRDIIRHIFGLRADLITFDYPGTWRSGGIPTEGGYYAAAETIVEMAHYDYGHHFKGIWVCGFCLGSAVAVHCKKKYHEEGINLFVQNAFNSMKKTFRRQIWPANIISVYGLPEVESNNPLVRALVKQDHFDSLRKLESLEGRHGHSIFVNTSTDWTIDPESAHDLVSAAFLTSEKTHSFLFDPPDKTRNGHSLDVLKSNGSKENRKVWDQCVDWIAQKDLPMPLAAPVT